MMNYDITEGEKDQLDTGICYVRAHIVGIIETLKFLSVNRKCMRLSKIYRMIGLGRHKMNTT